MNYVYELRTTLRRITLTFTPQYCLLVRSCCEWY